MMKNSTPERGEVAGRSVRVRDSLLLITMDPSCSLISLPTCLSPNVSVEKNDILLRQQISEE
jgi:hypothetical protein